LKEGGLLFCGEKTFMNKVSFANSPFYKHFCQELLLLQAIKAIPHFYKYVATGEKP
jgi:hypothetical protein